MTSPDTTLKQSEVIAISLPTNGRFKNLTDKQFTRLTVLSYMRSVKGRAVWLCRCKCGESLEVISTSLISGNSQSCGCLRKDTTEAMKTTHGHRKGRKASPEISAWYHAKQRCNDANGKSYHNYGGRGIRMCAGFAESSELFIALAGPKPHRSYQIDRKNNNGHYSCGQCTECIANRWPLNIRWVTREGQMRNVRKNILITYNSQTKTASEWAEITGVHIWNVLWRFHQGWPPERILT